MKNKNLISLSVAFAFLTLSVTGLLLYLVKHNHTTTGIHTVFGLLFTSFAVFHIINNWSSLMSYSRERATGGLQKELLVSSLVVGIFLAGTWLELPPFAQIDELGDYFRKGKDDKPRKPPGTYNMMLEVTRNHKTEKYETVVDVNKEGEFKINSGDSTLLITGKLQKPGR